MKANRKIRDWSIPATVAAAIVVAIGILSWPMVPASLKCWLAGASGAAWAQAVFTLIGLGIAIAIPFWQHRRDAQDREREQLLSTADTLQYLYFLAEQVQECIGQLRISAQELLATGSGIGPRVNRHEFSGLLERLQAAELKSIDGDSRIALYRLNRLLLDAVRLYTTSDGELRMLAREDEAGRHIAEETNRITRRLQARSDHASEVVARHSGPQDRISVIRRIGVDNDGNIDRVEWQEFDSHKGKWIGRPSICGVLRIAHHLRERVGPVFLSFDGHTVDPRMVRLRSGMAPTTGPVIYVDIDDTGSDRQTILDLPRL